ncbi:MAG TPA: SUMF1/EgtB/PvdO family nonheme iron enzyme [Thermoanaerobaculia bacterium]|nr:SUMF1/EgtB/PvdO family nonheme iron enzyme [Thermoanaerobaculia bacterium]
MIRRHTDFHLSIGLDEVRARCAGIEAQAEVQLSQFEGEMEELARALRNDPGGQIKGTDLGRRLYEAIFVGPVGELIAPHHPGRGTKRGLRLRLELDRKVSGWLWELLQTRGSFLAMSVKTPVVRDLDGNPFPVLRTAWPIRVLVVVPNLSGSPSLDAGQEVADIRKALGWRERLGLVKVEKLEPPTLAALKKRLDRGRFHVLHFIGHGSLVQEQGALLFEDANGERDWVDGERLGGVIGDDESLRLVILNACDSAHNSRDDLFTGVAQSLAERRIPAVIGMQSPVWDDMALAFSRRFYDALARRRPVDWAVARGRQEILATGKGLNWAIPVLFLSSSDGRLFRWRPSWGMLGAFLMIPLMLLGYWRWQSKVSVPATVPAPTYAQSCPPVEGLDMELTWIPAGTFTMGSMRGDEKPLHDVVISRPFCLGIYEVTQKQWESVMGANSVESRYRGDDLPVTYITWEEVQDFLERVNKQAGRKIVRLPTEAEWEYGARGSGGLPASFNCLHDQVDGLAPVRSRRTNRWGLHYMLGNAWEWVEDWYGPYPKSRVTDPRGPSSGEKKVKRGGGFNSDPRHCRAAKRNTDEPGSRANNLGFRVLRELDAGPAELPSSAVPFLPPEANLSR